MAIQPNPFATFNDAQDNLLSSFNPHGGLKLPNFNPDNNFGNPNAKASSVGSPFQMPANAAAASAAFGGTQFNAGANSSLNNVANSLNTAANKLSSAADKLIQAANAMAGRGGGGTGGPIVGGGGGGGTPNFAMQRGGGGGAGFNQGLNMLARATGFAADQYFNYTGADVSYNANVAQFQQGQQGIGSFYRNQEAQRQAQQGGVSRGLTFGAGAAITAGLVLAPFTGGASLLGAAAVAGGVGYSIGSQSAQQEAYSKAFGNTQADINAMNTEQYAAYRQDMTQAALDQKNAQAGVTSISGLLRAKAQFSKPEERQKLLEAAAQSDLINSVSGQYAGLEKQSIRLTGLRGGAVSTGLVKGDQFATYRTNLGIGTSEAMSLEASIIQASGRRGLNGLDANTITGAVQAGYGAGEIGLSSSFLRRGGGLRGLGFGATTLLGQANAQGLIGGAATEYMQAAGGFFGGFAQRGVSGFTEQNRFAYEGFINAGRNMDMRGFEGALGFKRAEEIAGLGQSVAGQIGGFYGNMGTDLLTASYLQEGMGTYQAYKASQQATPEEIQKRLQQQTGGNKEMMQGALMGRGLSPDVIDLMTTKDLSKMTDTERKLVSKGFSGTGAAAGSVTATLEKANQDLIDTFKTELAKQIINQEKDFKVQEMQKDLLNDIKTLLGGAKSTPKPLDKTKPQNAPIKDVSTPGSQAKAEGLF